MPGWRRALRPASHRLGDAQTGCEPFISHWGVPRAPWHTVVRKPHATSTLPVTVSPSCAGATLTRVKGAFCPRVCRGRARAPIRISKPLLARRAQASRVGGEPHQLECSAGRHSHDAQACFLSGAELDRPDRDPHIVARSGCVAAAPRPSTHRARIHRPRAPAVGSSSGAVTRCALGAARTSPNCDSTAALPNRGWRRARAAPFDRTRSRNTPAPHPWRRRGVAACWASALRSAAARVAGERRSAMQRRTSHTLTGLARPAPFSPLALPRVKRSLRAPSSPWL